MEKKITCCPECECTTFVSEPDSYSVYEMNNGKLEYQRIEFIEDDIKISCRECGTELINPEFE